jgi:molybdopterin converting factor small subunit
VRVYVPGPLRSYTGEKSAVEAGGATMGEMLDGLDRAYPGIRFRMIDERGRIREHIKLFVNGEQIRDLGVRLEASSEVHIICAISGGREPAEKRPHLMKQDALNKSDQSSDKSEEGGRYGNPG